MESGTTGEEREFCHLFCSERSVSHWAGGVSHSTYHVYFSPDFLNDSASWLALKTLTQPFPAEGYLFPLALRLIL